MAELLSPQPQLADEVVLLRPWRQSDVGSNLMKFADPAVQRFAWPHTRPYTHTDARDYFVEQEQARLRGEELSFAFVAPDEDDRVMGGGSLYDVNLEDRRAAVGYWLAADARGRGIATHAVRLIARWAFSELALARLQITCGPDNDASLRVAERCGFVREGLLRSHRSFKGARRDTIVLGLLPGELR